MTEPDDDFGPLDYEGLPPLRAVEPGATSWEDHLTKPPKGGYHSTVGNAALILANDRGWRGLRFNEMVGEAFLTERPPESYGPSPPRIGEVDDYVDRYIAHWLAMSRWGIKLSPAQASEAVNQASRAKGHPYHPVRDYLRGLVWDGQLRIDTWLTDYMQVAESAYTRAVGRSFLLSCVARAMRPGCKVDTTLILEGKQGWRKSTGIAALVPEPDLFSDTRFDIRNKDAFATIAGVWIYEIAEMDSFKGREATSIKAFLSSPVDRYRKAFGRRAENHPRQVVFYGTTNDHEWMGDSTGGRRFWPVSVEAPIDTVAIEQARDQLWAEAFRAFEAGEPWWLDVETERLAKQEVEIRTKTDVWSDDVTDYVRGRSGVTIAEILTHALDVDKDRWDQRMQNRISTILTSNGWKQRRRRIAGKVTREYYPAEVEQDDGAEA